MHEEPRIWRIRRPKSARLFPRHHGRLSDYRPTDTALTGFHPPIGCYFCRSHRLQWYPECEEVRFTFSDDATSCSRPPSATLSVPKGRLGRKGTKRSSFTLLLLLTQNCDPWHEHSFNFSAHAAGMAHVDGYMYVLGVQLPEL
jgi:hypothetical protein